MQQQDLLLAGYPASVERSRECEPLDTHIASENRTPEAAAEIVDLISRLRVRQRPKPAPTHDQAFAEQILRSFNTWAFKREQPSDTALILQVIAHAVSCAQPLSFVLYWGKGPRCSLAEPDIACLDFLTSLSDRIKQGYAPGAMLNLIFTDTHAELNGHHEAVIRKYFGEVDAAARDREFASCLLSELVRRAYIPPAIQATEERLKEDMLLKLIASARKWYRGPATPEDGARTYYRMNMVERRAVEAAFPSSIFITFNGSDLRPLFPQHMPIFYMYSLRRGFGVKPWFLPLDARACTPLSCRCVTPPNLPLPPGPG